MIVCVCGCETERERERGSESLCVSERERKRDRVKKSNSIPIIISSLHSAKIRLRSKFKIRYWVSADVVCLWPVDMSDI